MSPPSPAVWRIVAEHMPRILLAPTPVHMVDRVMDLALALVDEGVAQDSLSEAVVRRANEIANERERQKFGGR